MTPWKRRFLLEIIIFRGYVSFKEGIILKPEFLRFFWLDSPYWPNIVHGQGVTGKPPEFSSIKHQGTRIEVNNMPQ